MTIKEHIQRLSPNDGLSFLEHLAHRLTIMVRVAVDDRQPEGELTDEQARNAMFWINEALHNVVQMTRDLRIGRETWDSENVSSWVDMWTHYEHASDYVVKATERALSDLECPWNQ